jgi:hypothetical protein
MFLVSRQRHSTPSATSEAPSRHPPRRARRSANVRPGYRYSETSAPWVQEVSEMCPEGTGDDDDDYYDQISSQFFEGNPLRVPRQRNF